MLELFRATLAHKKAQFDRLRPLSATALAQWQMHCDIELVYTSNAIEGNALTPRETAEVIEHGVTAGGKSHRDQLEAVGLYDALLWMRAQASGTSPLGDLTVCELQRRVVARVQPKIAGVYSELRRRIRWSPVVFPNPLKIPQLMGEFGAWLIAAPPTPAAAFEAHFRLTAIHPFGDGNGRTARLLMNLLLLRAGYPPITVRTEDRKSYQASLKRGSLAGDLLPFQTLMHLRLNATLLDYLFALGQAPQDDSNQG